jgi:hypothetical protein
MSMKGLIFEPLTPKAEAAANRTDLACFIGLARVREGEPPSDLRAWLQQEGWWPTGSAVGARPATLYDVPLPVASWERFDQLFAWDEREYGEAGGAAVRGATYLGAAVRSFFAQGGRKCYVVSCGEPAALAADRAARDAMLLKLVPADIGRSPRREEWHGLHHLFGLPGASFVALPDLAELAAEYHEAPLAPLALPRPVPEFIECSQPGGEEPTAAKQVVQLAAPTCTDAEYAIWRDTVHRAAVWIADHRRDLQLLAALPLPHLDSTAAADLLAFMHAEGWLSGALAAGSCPAAGTDAEKEACSIASAFLQLGYPWLQAGYAGDLPAGLEPPEGVLAGLLARNALTRGTFRNGCALAPHNLQGLAPRLRPAQMEGRNPRAPLRASPMAPLIDRVSLFGPETGAIRLLSDVTTSNDAACRQANINRTIGLVMRAARCIGEEYVFESSGERLWQQLRSRLTDVLRAMHQAGALAGRDQADAFFVRCDRSTMTQNDLDNGRVIVQVMIHPAASIEAMRIQLAIGDGGRVTLSALGLEAA